jgi:hypothetical protein
MDEQTAQQQIEAFAESVGVEAGSVRWLAEYIIRETPEGHEDLLTDPEWLAACVGDWKRMTRHMAHRAHVRREDAALVVLDALRRRTSA